MAEKVNAFSCKMYSTMDKFVDWLNTEIERRGWSYREFARRAGLSASAVSDIMNQRSKPSMRFYRGVARAFRVSVDEVLRQAGELTSFDETDPRIREMLYYFEQLPEDLQDYLLKTAKALASQHAEETEKEKP